MKKWGNQFVLAWAVVALLLVTVPHLAFSAGKVPYKIGVNLELTGPWAETTKTLKMAMTMEVERINAQGGVDGHPLELVIKDNGFDQGRAAANMTEFARDKEILAVVGPFEDNLQATTRAIAEREKITNIIICPSNPMVRALKQRHSISPTATSSSRKNWWISAVPAATKRSWSSRAIGLWP